MRKKPEEWVGKWIAAAKQIFGAWTMAILFPHHSSIHLVLFLPIPLNKTVKGHAGSNQQGAPLLFGHCGTRGKELGKALGSSAYVGGLDTYACTYISQRQNWVVDPVGLSLLNMEHSHMTPV